MKSEVLIVGDGIAGTMLAFSLLRKHIPFKLISNDLENSTRIAAGICNPVVFKRMNKSWKANTLLPHATLRYTELSALLQENVFAPTKIYKLIKSEDEQRLWKRALNDVDLMDHIEYTEDVLPELKAFYKCLAVGTSNGLRIDTETLITQLLNLLQHKKMLIQGEFQQNELNLEGNQINWKGEEFKYLVFCEGHYVQRNSFFNYLPFKPVKGEVLIVKIPELKLKNVVNDKISICPINNQFYWVGATYEWRDLNSGTTEKGKQFLIENLERVLNTPFEIIEQKSGIRPAVSDRRPLLGAHPTHKNLFILNGFGTKGIMLAPYFSDQLVASIFFNGKIDKEVDVGRYDKYLAQ